MKKRLLSWLLILALCLSLLPAAALAEDAPEQTEAPVVRGQTEVPTVQERTESVQTVNDTAAQAAHTSHPICGAAHTDIGDHTGECPAVTWTPLTYQDSKLCYGGTEVIKDSNGYYALPAGNYYLDADIAISNTIMTTGNVNLCLNGHSITFKYAVNAIHVNSGVFTLTDCNGSNGSKKFTKGASGQWEPDTNGTITVSGGVITHESGWDGGGVDVQSGAAFTMYGGTICGNIVNYGNGGGVYADGTFNMYGGSITDNTAKSDHSYGGGVYTRGTFNMSGNAAITGNTTIARSGGGVYVIIGTFSMSDNAAITGNAAALVGGGVYVSSSTRFTMTGGSITGNTVGNGSSGEGGGVCVADGTFTMTGGSITGNNVTLDSGASDSEGGGGVHVHGGAATMNVSGDVQITDNWKNGTKTGGVYGKGVNGSANNFYLFRANDGSYQNTVTISSTLNGNAKIGITTRTAPTASDRVKIATGATGALSGYTAIFTPDVTDQGYNITKDDAGTDNLYLTKHAHDWTYTANDETKTITATCSNEGNSCPLGGNGGSVTLKAPAGTLTYTGMDQPATLENNLKTGNEAPTIIYTYERNGNSYSIENGGLPKNADTYTASITLGGQSVSVQYTIDPKPITVTVDPATRAYGDENPAFTATAPSGALVGSDTVASLGLTLTSTATATSNVGTYDVTGTAGNGNYAVTVEGTNVLTVEPKTITVAALDRKITVYESAPDLSNPVEGEDYTVTGTLFGTDALTAVTMRYSETPDTSKVGEYIINITATLANYDITTVPGKLTIEQAQTTPRLGILDGTRTVPGGTIETSPRNALPGQTVTITVTPRKGFELGDLVVRDIHGNKVDLVRVSDTEYTFVMPDSGVSVDTRFLGAGETGDTLFRDVPASAYYYDAVAWAVETGVTGGVGNNLFAPDGDCTRAQIVTFLWRAAGSPEPQSKANFVDVPETAYYAKAVAWASENGVTSGVGGKRFAPDQTCTRVQIVTFLYRAYNK